jgi:hypothetical protein
MPIASVLGTPALSAVVMKVRRKSCTRRSPRPSLAQRLFQTFRKSPRRTICPERVLAYHALGREQDSIAALADLIAKYRTTAAYQVAQAYSFRGESDKSFEWLEHAYKQRDPGLPEIKSNPLFKNLRHDPRYTELLKKMRLPI